MASGKVKHYGPPPVELVISRNAWPHMRGAFAKHFRELYREVDATFRRNPSVEFLRIMMMADEFDTLRKEWPENADSNS